MWGIAYKVPQEQVQRVREYLEWREKAGYKIEKAVFHPDEYAMKSFELEVYISPQTSDNEHYAGEESIEEIAQKVTG